MALGLCDVSKDSIDCIFRTKGNATVILIGGAKESMDSGPSMASLVLKGRKGFIKMALKHGYIRTESMIFLCRFLVLYRILSSEPFLNLAELISSHPTRLVSCLIK